MATTFEVLYLGTGPEIDPSEGNVEAEDRGLLDGNTYGSPAAPLAFNAQHILSPVDYSGGTTNMYDTDNTLSNDTFSIDGGPAQTFDAIAIYNATLTYTDGTPSATITAVVLQDTAGNLYLAPETSANSDHAALTAAPIESLTLNSATSFTGRLMADREFADFLCYAAGTQIQTARGEVPVETLTPGDQVVTLDHGVQTVRWTRASVQPLETVAQDGRPVLIGSGAFGPDIPDRDLAVSPQHGMLVGGQRQLHPLFDEEQLVPAKALTALRKIRHMNGRRRVEWVHFACDRHEIVRANGCWSESLLLGAMALRTMTLMERLSVAKLFGPGDASDGALNGPPARNKRRVAAVRREIRNAQHLSARP